MPTYSYRCPECQAITTKFLTMNSHRNTTPCGCGAIAVQVILSAPIGIVRAECRYQSPVDGAVITNRQARINDMARNGCVEYDPELRKDVDRKVIDDDARLARDMRQTLESEIEKMPSEKRERLGAELSAGVGLETVRN